MSFQELVNRREEGEQKQQDPNQALASAIFQINTSVSTFKHLVNSIGTPKDTPDLRLKLHRIRHQIGDLRQETSATLKAISDNDHCNETSRGRQIAYAKLAKDFQAVLKECQSAQRVAAQREASYTASVKKAMLPPSYSASQLNPTEGNDEEELALLIEQRRTWCRQEVLAMENERYFNEALIDERDQGIEAIQQQIGEVHEIFQDLAVLVREQGVMIDDIEGNVDSSHSATAQANKQLSKAVNGQKSNSSFVCLLLFIFGAAFIVAMIVFTV